MFQKTETKGECIVIRKSMQSMVLQRIYGAYKGIEKCQLKAKNTIYWRGINREREMIVGSSKRMNGFGNTERQFAQESDDWREINKDTEIIVGSSTRKPNDIKRMTNNISKTGNNLLKSQMIRSERTGMIPEKYRISKDTEIIVRSSTRKPNYIKRMTNNVSNTERQFIVEELRGYQKDTKSKLH